MPTGVVDIVPAARTLLLVTDPAVTSLSSVEEAVRSAKPRPDLRDRAEHVEIPVTYDGEDLEEAAQLLDCDAAELVRRHTSPSGPWRSAGSSRASATSPPRTGRSRCRAGPRPARRCHPAAVGLAGEFSGVYPRESPGGWQLIGRTALTMFDPARDPAAILRPGVRVRFVDEGARP